MAGLDTIWPTGWGGKILNGITKAGAILAMIGGLISWFVGFLNACIVALFDMVGDLFATLELGGLTVAGSVSFNVLEYVAYVNAVIPISEFVALMAVYVQAWVVVIGIRWVKSFFPTLAN